MTDQDLESVGDEALQLRRKRARYRAEHRGTKEMDFMLGRYAVARLEAMDEARLAVFEAFLQESDPEINAWLFDPALCPDARFGALIEDIRKSYSLD